MMGMQTAETHARTVAGVLACAMPGWPIVRRLTLRLEEQDALSVRAWLGADDDGTQLEMIGAPGEPWDPWMVTLGGLDARGRLVDTIAGRFEVSTVDAAAVERLVMRSAIVGSIAVEVGGVEGLHEFELQVRERLAVVEGMAA